MKAKNKPQNSTVCLAEHRWIPSPCAQERFPEINEAHINKEKGKVVLLSERLHTVLLDVVLGLGQVGTRD